MAKKSIGTCRAAIVLGIVSWMMTGSAGVLGGQTPSQQRAPRQVAGTVADETGGVLPSARVELLSASGAVIQTTMSDGSGRFVLTPVAAGAYILRASFSGLKPATESLRVGANGLDGVKLVLHLANVQEGVTVDPSNQSVSADAAGNLDAIIVNQDALKGLPTMDQDFVGTMSRFLDAGSMGGGGATLVVNGMEVSNLRVSASAIQQIKINQDPYSAEYSRPGRGRIEVLTKPGGQHFTSELNFVGRDGRLDAKNALATVKPTERKRIAEGILGGPVGSGGATSFLLSGSSQSDDQQGIVVAVGPSGPIDDQVPQPNRQALLSFALTHQFSKTTAISLTPSYEYEGSDNQGVGGTTLASAGTNFRHHEQQLRYNQQTSITPHLFNQFQILVGHERETTAGVSQAPGVVVAGAFTGGGAQRDLIRTETHTQMAESLTWVRGRHSLQAGFQLPDWSQRGFDDRTDFGGTYFFSNLDTLAAGRPYAFSQQQGNGLLSLLEKQVGVFVKDDWQVRPNVTVSAGLRYDWQNYFHDDNNVSPRMSFAFAPRTSAANVIRGGIGLYSDRSGPVILADLIHSERGDLQKFLVNDPAFPIGSAGGVGSQPRSLTVLAPGVQIPRTLQFGISLDHQIRKGLTTSVGYTGTRGYDLFRSRDINAPLPPFYQERPDPAYGVIRQIESTGRQVSHSVQVTLRGKVTSWFNGQTQYTWSKGRNDTAGLNSYPANDYDLTGEGALADFDRRHRLVLLGRITGVPFVDLGVGLTMNSAGPYTELLGADIYNNGRGRARPIGVGRNTLLGAAYAQLDLRAGHTVKASAHDARTLTVAVDVFNVLNRVNYGSYGATVGSPLFGQPLSARPPRQLQLSLQMGF